MKSSLGPLALLLLGLAFPACEGGSSGGSDSGFTTEECSTACSRIAAPDCGDIGQTCVDACVHHVQIAATSDCPRELRQYLDCFWTAAAFDCDAAGRTLAQGCDAALASHEACVSLDGADGGAGSGGAAGPPSAAGAAH